MATTESTTNGRREHATEPDVTIALDPHRPGIQRSRLVAYGVPVWALIGYLGRDSLDDEREIARTADDDEVPIEAVEAALAFYRQHRHAFDPLLDTLRAAAYSSNATGIDGA